jgi:hypothetical protein
MGKAWPQRALNRRFIPYIFQRYKRVSLLFFLHKLRKDLFFFHPKVFHEDHDVMFFPSLEGTLVRELSVSSKPMINRASLPPSFAGTIAKVTKASAELAFLLLHATTKKDLHTELYERSGHVKQTTEAILP